MRRAVLMVACALAVGALVLGRSSRGLAEGQGTLSTQSQEEADRKSAGCLACHKDTDARTMHTSPSVRLGCVDCHGGNATARSAGSPGSKEYEDARRQAHVAPRHAEAWPSAANPERSYTALLEERLEFVRFVNPGDLRAAPTACGPCHKEEVKNVSKSMMTHGGMLYAAALYNNGVLPGKDPIVGESYGPDGLPRMVKTVPSRRRDTRQRGGPRPRAVPALGAGPDGQPVPGLRARRPPPPRGGTSRPLRGARQARQGPLAPRPRNPQPDRPRDPGG